MNTTKHIDGVWTTSVHFYRGRKLEIKARPGKGMKVHIYQNDKSTDNYEDNKVEKTLRYSFIQPSDLLSRAKRWIDQWELTLRKLKPN